MIPKTYLQERKKVNGMIKNVRYMKFLLLTILLVTTFNVNAQSDYKLKDKYYYLCVQPFEVKMTDSLQMEINLICNQLDSLSYKKFCDENRQLKHNFDSLLNNLVFSKKEQSDDYLKQLCLYYYNSLGCYKYYYYIKKNSEIIIPYCCNYRNNIFQRSVLISLDIPNNLKDSLLTFKSELSLKERAKLGDTSAEDSIINMFKFQVENAKSRRDIEDLITIIDDLLYINSTKCINTLIDYMGCNILIEPIRNQWIISVLYLIICEYSKFFPTCYELSAVNLRYHSDRWTIRAQGFKMFHYEKRYVEQIQKYCLKQFGKVIYINLPFLELEDYEYYNVDDELDNILLQKRQCNN